MDVDDPDALSTKVLLWLIGSDRNPLHDVPGHLLRHPRIELGGPGIRVP